MNGPKILLVVSDNARRPAFSGLFKGLDCHVFTTISAEDALIAIEKFHPDIVLADMELEDMKANDFLKKIKQNPNCKNVQVVSFTKLLNYKITDPSILKLIQYEPKSEDADQALEILKEHIGPVPGEIVLWVFDAFLKKEIKVPVLMSLAVKILKVTTKT